MLQNHKIIFSKDFINDYSRDNKKIYKKGTHQEPEEFTTSQVVLDTEKIVSCSKSQDDLSECIRNYYRTFLTENVENNENERTVELLKCGKLFNEYESCLKKM